ncbi:MAG: hypothetical protein MUF23_19135, partial [Pirellula sp.]|nr:hypothetical protein [Pirellula sp.]
EWRAEWPGRTSASSGSCRFTMEENSQGLKGRKKHRLGAPIIGNGQGVVLHSESFVAPSGPQTNAQTRWNPE